MLELDRIYNMDCLEGMKQLDDNCIDLVIADPFYIPSSMFNWKNFDDFYWKFNKEWIKEVKRIIKKDFHFFIFFPSEDMVNFELLLKKLNFDIKSRIVWHYRNAGGRCNAKNMFGKTYEFLFHCSSGKILNFPEKWNDQRFDVQVIAMPQSNFKEGKYHKFQKPIKLIEMIISFASKDNDIILDPFLGSGNTIIVCRKLSRHFIGFDNDIKCIEIINKRLEQECLK